MKKVFISILLLVIIILGYAPKIAFALTDTVTFEGTVTNNGQPVPNASVLVSCENGSTSRYADHNGRYAIKQITICPFGKVAFVIAGPRHGSGHGSVQVIVNKSRMAVDVALGSEFTVPEYGWIGGLTAAIAGAGAIVIVRRRNYI